MEISNLEIVLISIQYRFDYIRIEIITDWANFAFLWKKYRDYKNGIDSY